MKIEKKTGRKGDHSRIFLVIISVSVLLLILIAGLSSCKKEESDQILSCISAGEHIPLPSAANGTTGCCEGLRTIRPSFPSTNPEYHISSLPEGCGISAGPTPICSDCGNEECEDWENECNCPEDCTKCSRAYNEIDNDLKNANYCETDSDCETLLLGGSYMEFGCYHYINKRFSKEEFHSRMMDYNRQCGGMIDECAWAQNATCVSGKCVESEEQKTTEENKTSNSEDYLIHGAIGVGFKMNVSQQEAEAVLEKYNLTFVKTDNLNLGMHFFFETGEKFAVKTGEGKEDYWISILDNESAVYGAFWLPDPDKILVD